MSFGSRLTKARKEKHLTQDGLGKGLGTDGKDASKAVVYGWEKDQHFPRVDQLVLICERLGVGADYLLFGKVESSQLRPEVQEIAEALSKLNEDQVRWAMRGIRFALESAPLHSKAEPRTEAREKAVRPGDDETVESLSSRKTG